MKLVMDTNVILAAMIKPGGLASLLIGLLDKEHFINYASQEALENSFMEQKSLSQKNTSTFAVMRMTTNDLTLPMKQRFR